MFPLRGVRHRAHTPVVGAATVPVTSTPSDTDCSRSSKSKGAPDGIAIRSSPIGDGLDIWSYTEIMAPGPRPSRATLTTNGDEGRCCAIPPECLAMPVILRADGVELLLSESRSRGFRRRCAVGGGRG